jgi:hypothetical protein
VDDPEAVGEDLLGPQHRLIEIPRVEPDCSNLYTQMKETENVNSITHVELSPENCSKSLV